VTDRADRLEVARCPACHGSFLPREGVCPRCGQGQLAAQMVPAQAVVLASTSMEFPPAGWEAPHGIVLLEGAEGVRLLATWEGPPPEVGRMVRVRREGARYRADDAGP
jgi:uncharacterized OB-fold protein